MDTGGALLPGGHHGDRKKSGLSSGRRGGHRCRLPINRGGFFFFGLLVTIWLLLNECISILENISEIGVPLPPFLVSLIQKLKKTTEVKGEELLK